MAKSKKGITDLIMDDLKKSLSEDSQFESTQIHADLETKFLTVSPKKKIKDEDFAKLMLGSDSPEKELSRVVPNGATQIGSIRNTSGPEGLPNEGQFEQPRVKDLPSHGSSQSESSYASSMDGLRQNSEEARVQDHNEAVTQIATDELIVEVGPAESLFFDPHHRAESQSQSEDDSRFSSPILDSTENTMAHEAGGEDSAHTEVKVGHSGHRGNVSREPWLQSNFHQAESLRIAQERVAALEKEIHELRKENQLLVTAAEFSQQKVEELNEKIFEIEKLKNQSLDQAQLEMNVYRENLFQRDKDLERARMKHEELDAKFRRDLNRVRVRERELENRLELSRAEKVALLASKDQKIIELKKKQDQMNQDIESLRNKVSEIQSKSQSQGEQIQRTIKTLRLALTHLESQSGPTIVTPLKKVD